MEQNADLSCESDFIISLSALCGLICTNASTGTS